jgi:hypothetical protein
MEYCRSLKFEQEPNYDHCINFFKGCIKRYDMDDKVFDFTWKQNRLNKDKEALKAKMLDVLKKNPKPAATKVTGTDQSGLATATKGQNNYDETQNQYGQ